MRRGTRPHVSRATNCERPWNCRGISVELSNSRLCRLFLSTCEKHHIAAWSAQTGILQQHAKTQNGELNRRLVKDFSVGIPGQNLLSEERSTAKSNHYRNTNHWNKFQTQHCFHMFMSVCGITSWGGRAIISHRASCAAKWLATLWPLLARELRAGEAE